MDGLTFRPLLASDAPRMLEILVAAEAAEPSESFTDLVEVTEELTEPGMNLPEDSVAALHDGRIVGFGGLYAPGPGSEWNVYLSGAVLPELRRGGLGRTVLDRLVARAKVRHDNEHPELPGVCKMWVSQGRSGAAALAESAGFTVRRHFFTMRADLNGPPLDVGELPAGLEVRTWTPDDDEAVRLAYNGAFADHWGSVPSTPERWQNLFAGSSFFRPEFSGLAVTGSDGNGPDWIDATAVDSPVVGFVMVAEFESETEGRGYRAGYVHLVGTVRAARGHGVARVLLARSMALLAESGCRYAELGVDADSPTGAGRLYEALGYEVLRRNQIWGLDF